MSRFAVGIDLGTAYTKAIIIDSDGQPLARWMKKNRVSARPGRSKLSGDDY
jgi:Ethanolamine utilization protein EutJ (predicted chaperonin)